MSETINEQAATETAAPQTTPAQDQVEVQDAPQPKMFEESYVKELREEAASWRTKTRDLEAKLKDAKSMEEVNKITSEYGKALHDKDVQIVAIKHNIPEALRDRLRGETVEELEKDAEAIASLLKAAEEEKAKPAPASLKTSRPNGGLDPAVQDTLPYDDPAAMARRFSRRNKFDVL